MQETVQLFWLLAIRAWILDVFNYFPFHPASAEQRYSLFVWRPFFVLQYITFARLLSLSVCLSIKKGERRVDWVACPHYNLHVHWRWMNQLQNTEMCILWRSCTSLAFGVAKKTDKLIMNHVLFAVTSIFYICSVQYCPKSIKSPSFNLQLAILVFFTTCLVFSVYNS